MTLKQLTDALHEGKKVGIKDLGYIYLNIEGKLIVEDLTDYWNIKYELIGEIFSRYKECVIFPEEGI